MVLETVLLLSVWQLIPVFLLMVSLTTFLILMLLNDSHVLLLGCLVFVALIISLAIGFGVVLITIGCLLLFVGRLQLTTIFEFVIEFLFDVGDQVIDLV